MDEWLLQVLVFFKTSQDLSGLARASSIVFLAVGLLKVSALSSLWDKLGAWKPFLAPVLSIAGALLTEFSVTGQVSIGVAFIALTHGVGALAIADLLDAIKKIPRIGKIPLAIISFLEKILRKDRPKT